MYRIWSKIFKNGELIGTSVSVKSYVRKGNAIRVAKKRYDVPRGDISFTWIVSEINPFNEN